jgi:thymidine kinase
MFGGKSSELLRQLSVYSRCFKTVFITHTIDNRQYISHNPTIHSTLKNSGIDYKQCSKIVPSELSEYTVIGIDEAQFMTNLRDPIVELAKQNKIIIVAGLDSDYMQKPFMEIMMLIPYATHVEKFSALCNACIAEKSGVINLAPMTIRKNTLNNERIVVGQDDIYGVSCLRHMS